ncbi:autotransporter-associated beta strand repeat-containing protein [Achromobacter mucicolens]|uniref:autotransporter-associated beta strand repeat-containing protein n=1 Tax=Achromobacter mucicolens TaxID=1389922 RepID=UPI00244ABA73|nr:autotransporter-associated beta strand repeat-containing protein [Achromobacter mucicolens]MDG9967934.1 autotransporter-associated beta strand repeat-containing protein [Achromobacter mucicolens]
MLGLTCALPSVWAAGCAPGDASACGAAGGAGYPGRSGNGGAGNGQGGGSSELDANTVTVTVPGGAPGANGSGGSGAAGDAGGNAAGGATGLALSSTNVGVNTSFGGAAGNAGADGTNFGGGGGGGGTGLYYSGTEATIDVNAAMSGGAGGAGGTTSNGAVGNAGAGGGGGAGMISITTGANLTSHGLLQGGGGGAGGPGGFGGGGGGGGDGLVVFGTGSSILNLGEINGGAGGAGGTGANGNGTGGDGGAGVNFAGGYSTILNAGTITGGSSNGGAAGAGVIAHGFTNITNAGTIVGGVANGTRAAAIQFEGSGNSLTLLSGSTLLGDLVIAAGASAQINPAHQGLSLGNAVILTDAASAVSFNTSTAPLTLTGTISGFGGVTAMGGTLSTSAVHGYTGATTITSGTLALTGNGSIAASSGLVNNGRFDISATTAGASLKALSGTGVIELGSQSLTVNSAAGDFSGVIGGAGGFTVAGGTQTLSGVNIYTGATDIGNGATLALAGNGSLAASSGVINNGTFDISGASANASIKALTGAGITTLGSRTLTLTNAAGTYAGAIDGTGGITLNAGTQTLSGVNTYTGATDIGNGATLALAGNGSIAASSGLINNGTFDISGATAGASITALTGAGITTLGSRTLTLTNAAGTYAGSIGGTGGITLNAGTQTLTGNHTYSGATTINGGTLALTGNGSIAASSGLVNNGRFDISATTAGASLKALSGTGVIELGSQSLTVNSAAGDFSGVIGGAGGFTVAGGTQTLSGVNTYTGATDIGNGATLALAGNGSLAASSGVINNGTFDISGTTAGASVQALTGAGATTLGSRTLTLTNAAGTYAGAIDGTGGITLNAGTQTLTGNNTYSGATTINGGTLALAGNGNIAASSGLVNNGRFDISGTAAGASLKALSGTGVIALGSQSLTVNSAAGDFSGVIGGAGGFTVAGGTQTFSGVNIYTGATDIGNGATLALAGSGSLAASSGVINNGTFDISSTTAGASITALTGAGITTLGSRTLTLTNAAGTYAGAIGGTGGITLNAGTQTLTGNNTYSGATKINGGTLALAGNGGAAASNVVVNNGTFDISGATAGASVTGLSGGGAVALGSRTLTISNAASAFGGAIDGTGGLTVGGGTQTLTGANTYTGATTISPGATLAVNGAGSIAASSGITNQGTLDISGTAAGASVTSLSGSGNVALGARTLTLTNAAGNFSGAIAGTGGLTLNGGTQVLAGTNNYTGATTINSGTLAVTGSLSSASNVVLAGPGAALDVSGAGAQRMTALAGGAGTRLQLGTSTLTLDSPADSTFGGALNGSGVFAKQGAGMLTLNGDSSGFAGLTRVDGGTLAVGDANHDTALLGGNVAVGAQGTLKGHGTIAGSLLNQGIVMPGGSVGTLSVGGNYTQASNATLSIEVNPLESSLLRVGGAATLDGGLSIVYAPGTYTARRYTLLSAANGVNGTFATVTSTTSAGADLSTLNQSVTYGANEVGLQLFSPDAPGPVIVAPTNTSIYTALGTAAIMRAQSVNATLLGRFVPSPQTQPAARGAWIEATGSSTRLHADDGQPGFKANQFGFLAGSDRRVGDYTVGLAGGYAHTSLDEDETGSSGATDTVRLALYGGRDFGPVTVSATLGYGLDFLSQKRPFGASGTAQGDHIGHEISAATQAAVPMRVGSITLTPAAGLRYAFFRGASFTESGASAQNLSVDSDTARSLQPYVMLKLDKTFGEKERAVDAQLRVGYARELMGTSRQVTVLSQDGTRFAAPGVALPRNYVTGGASIGFRPSKATSISVGYDALINTGHASAQAGYARFEYQF